MRLFVSLVRIRSSPYFQKPPSPFTFHLSPSLSSGTLPVCGRGAARRNRFRATDPPVVAPHKGSGKTIRMNKRTAVASAGNAPAEVLVPGLDFPEPSAEPHFAPPESAPATTDDPAGDPKKRRDARRQRANKQSARLPNSRCRPERRPWKRAENRPSTGPGTLRVRPPGIRRGCHPEIRPARRLKGCLKRRSEGCPKNR